MRRKRVDRAAVRLIYAIQPSTFKFNQLPNDLPPHAAIIAPEANASPAAYDRACLPSERQLVRDQWSNVERFRSNCKRAKKASDKLFRRRQRALDGRDDHLANALLKKIAYSRSAALAAVMEANASVPRKYRKGCRKRTNDPAQRPALLATRRAEQSGLLDMARNLFLWDPCAEEVRVKAQDRPGKSVPRITQNFGIENRARQITVRKLLTPIGLEWTAANQFGIFRGGRNAAISAVKQNLTDGLTTVHELDFANCYMSLDPIWFADCMGQKAKESPMRLPRKIIRNLVATPMDANLRIIRETPIHGTITLACLARRGLAQGSILSPLIAEMMLAFIVGNLPDNENRRIVVLADNVLIMTKDRRTAEESALSLRAISEWHPAGRLSLTSKQGVRRAQDGFEFLGYRIRYRKREFEIVPIAKRMADKLEDIYADLRSYREAPTRKLWKRMRRRVVGFRHGFAHWTSPEDWSKEIHWTVAHVFGLGTVGERVFTRLTGMSPSSDGRPTREEFESLQPGALPFGALAFRPMPLNLL